MGNKIKSIIAVAAIILSGVAMAAPVSADDASLQSDGYNNICGTYKDKNGNDVLYITDPQERAAAGCNVAKDANVMDNFKNIITFASGAVSVIAVLVIVVSGQRIVTANGDATKIKQAKNMLLYAVIAIIISLLAFAVVQFVASSIAADGGAGSL